MLFGKLRDSTHLRRGGSLLFSLVAGLVILSSLLVAFYFGVPFVSGSTGATCTGVKICGTTYNCAGPDDTLNSDGICPEDYGDWSNCNVQATVNGHAFKCSPMDYDCCRNQGDCYYGGECIAPGDFGSASGHTNICCKSDGSTPSCQYTSAHLDSENNICSYSSDYCTTSGCSYQNVSCYGSGDVVGDNCYWGTESCTDSGCTNGTVDTTKASCHVVGDKDESTNTCWKSPQENTCSVSYQEWICTGGLTDTTRDTCPAYISGDACNYSCIEDGCDNTGWNCNEKYCSSQNDSKPATAYFYPSSSNPSTCYYNCNVYCDNNAPGWHRSSCSSASDPVCNETGYTDGDTCWTSSQSDVCDGNGWGCTGGSNWTNGSLYTCPPYPSPSRTTCYYSGSRSCSANGWSCSYSKTDTNKESCAAYNTSDTCYFGCVEDHCGSSGWNCSDTTCSHSQPIIDTNYTSGGHCYYGCSLSCTDSGWSRSGCTDGGTQIDNYYLDTHNAGDSDDECFINCDVECTSTGWQRSNCESNGTRPCASSSCTAAGWTNCECSVYSDSSSCEGNDNCDWCNECSGKKYSGGSDSCVLTNSCSYSCSAGHCNAECDSSDDYSDSGGVCEYGCNDSCEYSSSSSCSAGTSSCHDDGYISGSNCSINEDCSSSGYTAPTVINCDNYDDTSYSSTPSGSDDTIAESEPTAASCTSSCSGSDCCSITTKTCDSNSSDNFYVNSGGCGGSFSVEGTKYYCYYDGGFYVSTSSSPPAENTAAKCSDGYDNDCDGKTDLDDPDCISFRPENCTNGIDDDNDGYIDCADSECQSCTLCNSQGDACSGTSCSSNDNSCNCTTENSNYDSACRAGPSCVSSTYWEYTPSNDGDVCAGSCLECSSGLCAQADSSKCPDTKCYEPACNATDGSCYSVPVAYAQTDEACYGDTGCSGGNCKCDGAGNCISITEICDNGIDDDGNGKVDCADSACPDLTSCGTNKECCGGSCQDIPANSYDDSCSTLQCNNSGSLEYVAANEGNVCEGQCLECSSGLCAYNDTSQCTDNICYEPTCSLSDGSCGEYSLTNGDTDEACYDNTGCGGVNCDCWGGSCVSDVENCSHAGDEDHDGYADCNDTDCAGLPGPDGAICCPNGVSDCPNDDCKIESCVTNSNYNWKECSYTNRPANATDECATCYACNTAGGDCVPVTANEGKNCAGECTYCNNGVCTNRADGDYTECTVQCTACSSGSCQSWTGDGWYGEGQVCETDGYYCDNGKCCTDANNDNICDCSDGTDNGVCPTDGTCTVDDDADCCRAAGYHWDSNQKACCDSTTDYWCDSNGGSCINGIWYDDHCSDGVQNCGETSKDDGGPDCTENCTNGIDDDGDGKVDCADPGCWNKPTNITCGSGGCLGVGYCTPNSSNTVYCNTSGADCGICCTCSSSDNPSPLYNGSQDSDCSFNNLACPDGCDVTGGDGVVSTWDYSDPFTSQCDDSDTTYPFSCTTGSCSYSETCGADPDLVGNANTCSGWECNPSDGSYVSYTDFCNASNRSWCDYDNDGILYDNTTGWDVSYWGCTSNCTYNRPTCHWVSNDSDGSQYCGPMSCHCSDGVQNCGESWVDGGVVCGDCEPGSDVIAHTNYNNGTCDAVGDTTLEWAQSICDSGSYCDAGTCKTVDASIINVSSKPACSSAVECTSDSECFTSSCQQAVCSKGKCMRSYLPYGDTSTLCHDSIGCSGGNCGCDGSGSCISMHEICDDGTDNDGDGKVDCADPDCPALAVCGTNKRCCGGSCQDVPSTTYDSVCRTLSCSSNVLSYTPNSGDYCGNCFRCLNGLCKEPEVTLSNPYVTLNVTIQNTGEVPWCFLTESYLSTEPAACTEGDYSGDKCYYDNWGDSASYLFNITLTTSCTGTTGAKQIKSQVWTDKMIYGGTQVAPDALTTVNVLGCLSDADCASCFGPGIRCNTTTHKCGMPIARESVCYPVDVWVRNHKDEFVNVRLDSLKEEINNQSGCLINASGADSDEWPWPNEPGQEWTINHIKSSYDEYNNDEGHNPPGSTMLNSSSTPLVCGAGSNGGSTSCANCITYHNHVYNVSKIPIWAPSFDGTMFCAVPLNSSDIGECPGENYCVYNKQCYSKGTVVELDGDVMEEKCDAWSENVENCTNGVDDDGDSLIDGDDPDCNGYIIGYVINDTSNITDARVDVEGVGTVYTDSSGIYNISVRGSEYYSVTASYPGYEPVTKGNVFVDYKEVKTVNFYLERVYSECKPDCTLNDVCDPTCDKINGCYYASNITKQLCEGHAVGHQVDYNDTYYVTCCTGNLTEKTTPINLSLENVSVSAKNIITTKRIALYNGKPVTIVVNVFN